MACCMAFDKFVWGKLPLLYDPSSVLFLIIFWKQDDISIELQSITSFCLHLQKADSSNLGTLKFLGHIYYYWLILIKMHSLNQFKHLRSPAIVWSVWACQTGKCYHVLIMHKLMGEGMLCTNVVVGALGQYWPLTLQSVARPTYLSNGTCTPRVNPDQ